MTDSSEPQPSGNPLLSLVWIALKIAVVMQFGYHAVPFTYQGF